MPIMTTSQVLGNINNYFVLHHGYGLEFNFLSTTGLLSITHENKNLSDVVSPEMLLHAKEIGSTLDIVRRLEKTFKSQLETTRLRSIEHESGYVQWSNKYVRT